LIREIIMGIVHEYGGEIWENIIIEDIEDLGLEVL
jgi:hypothetical protein